MKKVEAAKVAQVISLRAQGESYREIADKINLNKNTVMTYVQKYARAIAEERDSIIREVKHECNFTFKTELKFQLESLHEVRSHISKFDPSTASLREFVQLEALRMRCISAMTEPNIREKYIESDMSQGTGVKLERTIKYHAGDKPDPGR